jgi:hypothetical protein
LNLDYKFITEEVTLFFQISPNQNSNYIAEALIEGNTDRALAGATCVKGLLSPKLTLKTYPQASLFGHFRTSAGIKRLSCFPSSGESN